MSALERELRRVPEISAARVVSDDQGTPVEVHIVATPTKGAKQIARDVQSVALASCGIDLDHRTISVVQLDPIEGDGLPRAAIPRIVVDEVTVVRSATAAAVSVALAKGDERSSRVSEGLPASANVLRLTAQATLGALAAFEPAAGGIHLEHVSLAVAGDRRVALTVAVFVSGAREEELTGAAIVRPAGDLDAVARATLDATNRRLSHLG